MKKSRSLLLAGALALAGASFAVATGTAYAATVPAPIYDQNHTLFGAGPAAGPMVASKNISIAPQFAGNYRFTLTNIGNPGGSFPPFDALGFTINEKGTSTNAFESTVPASVILALTAAQTYFINVIGATNPAAFLNNGTFNLEVVQVIPIPAAAVLFSSAIIGLVVVARRRNTSGSVVTA